MKNEEEEKEKDDDYERKGKERRSDAFFFNIKVGSLLWKKEDATIINNITDISYIYQYQEMIENS